MLSRFRWFAFSPFFFAKFLLRGCGVREAAVWSVAAERGAPEFLLRWAFAQLDGNC